MWNEAYTLIERPNAVKAILPEDPATWWHLVAIGCSLVIFGYLWSKFHCECNVHSKDWPHDFELPDARFNTISWDLAPSTFSMGIAKVHDASWIQNKSVVQG